jgi:VWFA-related protein
MHCEKHLKQQGISPAAFTIISLTAVALMAGLLLVDVPSQAQTTSSSSSSQAQSQQAPPQDQSTPEAGGPGGEVGPIAVPKKKEGSDEAPPPPKPKKQTDIPEYSLHVDVPVVTVDARVIQKDGRPLALPAQAAKDHFRVYEDGVPQKIQSVTQSEAPITAVLLVEFASTNYNFMYDALNASYMFASNLKPQDWVAVIEFDMKDHILVDFTQDKQAIFGALNRLRIPGFSETNIFDAMYDTLDRLDRIPGHKEMVVVASGRDTFSKITFDTILKKVKATPNVTIYVVSTGRAFLEWADARAGSTMNGTMMRMDFLQADNEMNTFAKLTGGRWYSPRMEGELPDIFREIAQAIRNQYTISYKPTNTKQDGTYRKVKVELVGPDDKPLIIKDEKNHDVKYQIVARDGYTAKHEVD